MPEAAVPQSARERGLQFFRADDAEDFDASGMMARPSLADSVLALLAQHPSTAGHKHRVLFRGSGPDGLSLVRLWFGAHYRLPRHSHDVDCLYFVLSGEVHMNKTVLRAGDGFLVRAGAPYAYAAGPDGVEVLEFRTATSFDITIHDQTPERWQPVVDAVVANEERWRVDRETV